jgi:hypothetical protein
LLAKFAGGKRLADYLLRAIGTLATTTCHSEALPKITQGMRAFTYGIANLAFGNSVAEANVHGAPESSWGNTKSQ